MAAGSGLVIGVDVGGTFTDAVVLDAGSGALLDAFKVSSTVDDPSTALKCVLERVATSRELVGARILHGTTVGTNTLIERRGATLALVTTKGFTDVIEMRRQDRPTLYDLDVRVSKPLVDRELRFGISERMGPDGQPLAAPTGIDELIAKLRAADVEAVAVCLLHSYANPLHERMVGEAIAAAMPSIYVTLSHDVCPELGEYERTSTALVNSYIGPPVSRYMRRLNDLAVSRGIRSLRIVKSNGGVTSSENAANYPVHLVESGPAAGMIAAAAFARAIGGKDLIAFDMGGTTAKAGVVIDGEPRASSEFRADRLVEGRDLGGHLIRGAVLDIVEIGAGGGSIAHVDEGGVLKIGPRSAGAVPGPACYSRGGTLPTVTDAHAVIGSLSQEVFKDGSVDFDRDKAVEAIETHIARPLGWTLERAAYSIIDIAVAHMAEMVRLATVRRGLDPRSFSMLASGGAGPLHAAAVGAEVGVRRTIVPPLPGMFSALGATLGEVRHDLAQTALHPIVAVTPAFLASSFIPLKARAEALVEREGVAAGIQPRLRRHADLRFAGQLFELGVAMGDAEDPMPESAEIERRFRDAYRSEFGFDLDHSDVQLVRLRLVVTLPRLDLSGAVFDPAQPGAMPAKLREQTLLARDGTALKVPVYEGKGTAEITGPALVELTGSIVWIHGTQKARIGAGGAIEIIEGDDQ